MKKIQDKKRVVKSLDLKSKKTLLVFLPSLTALLWIACQSGSIVGDVLIDAGDALNDSSAASAQEPDTIQRNCDVEREWTLTEGSGAKSTTTGWFAEVSLEAGEVNDIRNVDVILCDYERYQYPVFSCPPGATCEGDLLEYHQAKCASANASFKDGILWVSCGSRSRRWNAAGQLTSDVGSKAATAKITIWK